MHLPMTGGMQEEQVGKMVRAAIDPVENVMDMPATLFRDFLVADGTPPFLLVPESDELSSLEPALEPLESHSFVEVGFVGWIVRVGFPLDQAVSLDACLCCVDEVNCQGLPFPSLYLPSEHPLPLTNGMKVFLFHPSPPFLRMPPLCPLPEEFKDSMIHEIKGSLARHMPVIQGPPPNDRV